MASGYTFNGISLDDPQGRWSTLLEVANGPDSPGKNITLGKPGKFTILTVDLDHYTPGSLDVTLSVAGGEGDRKENWLALLDVMDAWRAGGTLGRVSDSTVVPAHLEDLLPLGARPGGALGGFARFRMDDLWFREQTPTIEEGGAKKFAGSVYPVADLEVSWGKPTSGCSLRDWQTGRGVMWWGDPDGAAFLNVDLSRSLAVLSDAQWSYSGVDVSGGLLVDPDFFLLPVGTAGECGFSGTGGAVKVRARRMLGVA